MTRVTTKAAGKRKKFNFRFVNPRNLSNNKFSAQQ